MIVSLGAKSANSNMNVNAFNINVTAVGGSAHALVAMIHSWTSTFNAPTCIANGVPMTQVISAVDDDGRIDLFWLYNPPAGSYNVAVSAFQYRQGFVCELANVQSVLGQSGAPAAGVKTLTLNNLTYGGMLVSQHRRVELLEVTVAAPATRQGIIVNNPVDDTYDSSTSWATQPVFSTSETVTWQTAIHPRQCMYVVEFLPVGGQQVTFL